MVHSKLGTRAPPTHTQMLLLCRLLVVAFFSPNYRESESIKERERHTQKEREIWMARFGVGAQWGFCWRLHRFVSVLQVLLPVYLLLYR